MRSLIKAVLLEIEISEWIDHKNNYETNMPAFVNKCIFVAFQNTTEMARGIRSTRTKQRREKKKHIEETTSLHILKEREGMSILAIKDETSVKREITGIKLFNSPESFKCLGFKRTVQSGGLGTEIRRTA